MLRSKYYDLFRSDELRQLAPGFYVDLLGGGYFYLTGMYASISYLLRESAPEYPSISDRHSRRASTVAGGQVLG